MKTGTIRQVVTIPASPKEVYTALMTSKGHEAFSGAPARISRREGGAFTAWGGYIHGRNLTLLPDRKIVQEWRPSEETWPDGHLSRVTYLLAPTSKGTRIRFTHSRVPREHVAHLARGWHESYWRLLRVYFATRS